MNKQILFSKIDKNLPIKTIDKANRKLDSLLTELSLRKDNYHVGSGLGGDPKTLAFFLCKKHELVSGDVKLAIANDVCIWGADFLEVYSLKEIRKELLNFPEIENFNHPSLSDKAIDFSKFLPNELKTPPGENNLEVRMKNAFAVCASMAKEIDTDGKISDDNKNKFVEIFGEENNFITLYAIRSQITIERIVKANLDEIKEFRSIFTRVNDSV